MSNYAPDPKKQLVYTNLQNKTLSNVSADDIDKLTDPTFLQATNQDALITYNIINQSAFRNSGTPMPNTGIIKSVTATDNGTLTVFRPNLGEVYLVSGADITATGGAVRFKWNLTDGVTSIEIKDVSATSATVPLDITTSPLYIDNNMFLQVNFSAITGSVEGNVKIGLIRTR